MGLTWWSPDVAAEMETLVKEKGKEYISHQAGEHLLLGALWVKLKEE